MEYFLFSKEQINNVVEEYRKYYKCIKLQGTNKKFIINPDLKPIVYNYKEISRQTEAEKVIYNAYKEIELYKKDESRVLILLTSFSLAISALLEEIDITRIKELLDLPAFKNEIDELICDVSSELFGSYHIHSSNEIFLKGNSSKSIIEEIYDIEKVPSYSQKTLRCINFVAYSRIGDLLHHQDNF